MGHASTSLEQSAINACVAARTLVKALEGLDTDAYEAAAFRELLKSIKRLAERQVRRLRRQAPSRNRDETINLLTLLLSEIPRDVAADGGRGPKAN